MNSWLYYRWVEIFKSSYFLNFGKRSECVGDIGISKRINEYNRTYQYYHPDRPDPFLEAWRSTHWRNTYWRET